MAGRIYASIIDVENGDEGPKKRSEKGLHWVPCVIFLVTTARGSTDAQRTLPGRAKGICDIPDTSAKRVPTKTARAATTQIKRSSNCDWLHNVSAGSSSRVTGEAPRHSTRQRRPSSWQWRAAAAAATTKVKMAPEVAAGWACASTLAPAAIRNRVSVAAAISSTRVLTHHHLT